MQKIEDNLELLKFNAEGVEPSKMWYNATTRAVKAVEDYMDADPKLSASAAAKKLPKNEIAARYAVHLANLSGQLVANVSCAALVKWLSEGRKTGRTDMFVRNCYLFATSRTESSARFVIGK